MNTKIKRLALYARVSTANQEDQETIKTQIDVMEEHCKKNGYIIVERYYDEGWSGDALVRPEIDRLRLEIKDAEYDAVLSYDRDRIARRYSYQELIIDEIAEAGKEVLFVTTAVPKNGEEKILSGVKGLFAEYERVKIAERMRLGKLRKVKEGVMILSEAPYGYDYVPKVGKIDGYIKINEVEAKVVRMIFDFVAKKQYTIKKVIHKLFELEIKPRKSKNPYWSSSTIGRMLKKTAYMGDGLWNVSNAIVPKRPQKIEKYRKIKKTSRNLKPKEEWLNVPVPAIIDAETFALAQEQMRINSELCPRNRHYEYLLSGFIYCNCGRRRNGEGIKQGQNLYYRCTDRILTFPLPRTCFERSVDAKKLDKIIWGRVSKIMSDEELLKAQLERWTKGNLKKESSYKFDVERMRNELVKLAEKEDRHNKAYGDGAYTLEQLKTYTDPTRKRTAELMVKVEEFENKMAMEKLDVQVPDKNKLQEFVNTVKSNLENLDFETKKGIISNIIQKVVGNNEKLTITGFIPLNLSNIYVKSQTEYRYCWTTQRR